MVTYPVNDQSVYFFYHLDDSLHLKIVFTGKTFLVYTVHSGGQAFQKPREQHNIAISQFLVSSDSVQEQTGRKQYSPLKVLMFFYLTTATLLSIYW